MTERNNLGKGLDALLGEDVAVLDDVIGENDVDSIMSSGKGSPLMVDIHAVKPNENQPRKRFDDSAIDELVASIKDKGIIQPIIVRNMPGESGTYQIIAGERRYRAATRCELEQVPVIIKEISDIEVMEYALIENISRQDLTPMEEAEGYQALIDSHNYTQEKLAEMLGKSRSNIANTLRLLALPEDVKSMVDDGHLSSGHARSLVGIEQAFEIAEKIVKNDLSVRQTESLVKQYKEGTVGKKQKIPTAKDNDIIQLEMALKEKLGTKVAIDNKGGKGKISLHYKDLEQLDTLIQVLTK